MFRDPKKRPYAQKTRISYVAMRPKTDFKLYKVLKSNLSFSNVFLSRFFRHCMIVCPNAKGKKMIEETPVLHALRIITSLQGIELLATPMADPPIDEIVNSAIPITSFLSLLCYFDVFF